jgi:hypothetical protein
LREGDPANLGCLDLDEATVAAPCVVTFGRGRKKTGAVVVCSNRFAEAADKVAIQGEGAAWEQISKFLNDGIESPDELRDLGPGCCHLRLGQANGWGITRRPVFWAAGYISNRHSSYKTTP